MAQILFLVDSNDLEGLANEKKHLKRWLLSAEEWGYSFVKISRA